MSIATILATFTALLGIGIDTASARCFQSGVAFENKGDARYHAQRACEGYDGKAGAFQGVFQPGQFKNACVNVSPTQSIKMSVGKLNAGVGFDLRDDDCTLRLWNEIDNCLRGGETDTSGWRFRIDPNNERC